MSLPVYDSLKHHIGLGLDANSLKGFILSGGYRRDPQRLGGSPKYGGEGDVLSAGTLARWTQDDFSGGGYQETFGTDGAMFADSQNILPNLVERSARTVAPLEYWDVTTPPDGDDNWLGAFASGSNVVVFTTDTYSFWTFDAGVENGSFDPAHDIQASAHDPADNLVYAVTKRLSDSAFLLYKVTTAGVRTKIADLPTSANGPVRGMIVTAGRDVLISMGTTLYLADVNDARDDATFVRIGRLPGRWRDAVTYNGLTYILLTDSEQRTQVVTWDGTQVLPVTDFPYNFVGRSIQQYAGRIYVGGAGADISGTDHYGELYEITGASLRLVKSFCNEARAGLVVPNTFPSMIVHEGLLFIGTDLGYLIAYDVTRDALWPKINIESSAGHPIRASFLLSAHEKLVVLGYDTNRTSPEDGFYRLATVDSDVTGSYDSFLETSDFAPEPDRDKRWSRLRVVCRYDSPTLEISRDGGLTWDSSIPGVADPQSGNLVYVDYDLSGLDVSAAIRFRFTFTKSTVAYSEIIAFTCSFFWLDSGKQGWSVTVLGADRPEHVDGNFEQYDVATLRSTLWGYWTDRTTLTFRDLDGTDHTVFVSDMSETQPTIADAVDGDGTREAFYSLVLTEI